VAVAQKAWRFDVTVERTADTAVLKLAGRFGHEALPAFDQAARKSLETGAHGIVIDLAGVDYLSSPGLRAIVALATEMQARKGQVIVRGARDAVRVTLGLADFARTKQSTRRW
jgi:anti-anti-sigma factor